MVDSFLYTVPSFTENLNPFVEYKKFLECINLEFHIVDNCNWEIKHEAGLSIYNRKSLDIVVRLITNSQTYVIRFDQYQKLEYYSSWESFYKNFMLIADIYNRFLLENNIKKRIAVKKQKSINSNDVVIEIHFSEHSYSVVGEDIYFCDYQTADLKVSEIKQTISQYKRKGIFNLISTKTEERGNQLAIEYPRFYPTDLLWSYQNLIISSCPRESSGYESELKSFLYGTNNTVTYSNFRETNQNGKKQISFLINGKPFKVSNLPEYFSFRFIKALNEYLGREYNTSFYIWNWERNPWEQRTFIYLETTTFNKYYQQNKKLNELEELSDDTIVFYDQRT